MPPTLPILDHCRSLLPLVPAPVKGWVGGNSKFEIRNSKFDHERVGGSSIEYPASRIGWAGGCLRRYLGHECVLVVNNPDAETGTGTGTRRPSRTAHQASQALLEVEHRLGVIGAAGSEPDRLELAPQLLHLVLEGAALGASPRIHPPPFESHLELTGTLGRTLSGAARGQRSPAPPGHQQRRNAAQSETEDEGADDPRPQRQAGLDIAS